MGRTVQPRVSFQADIAFLTRMIRAVEIDKRIKPDKRKKLIGTISELQALFMEIERERLASK